MFSFSNKRSIRSYNKKVRTLFTTYTLIVLLTLSIFNIIVTAIMSNSKGHNTLKANVSGISFEVENWFNNYNNKIISIGTSLEQRNLKIDQISKELTRQSEDESLSYVKSLYVVCNTSLCESESKKYQLQESFISSVCYSDTANGDGSVVVSEPFVIDSKKYLTFSYRITIENITSVVAIDVSLDELDNILSDSKNGKTYFFIVDSDQEILCHPNNDFTIINDNSTLKKVANGGYKNLVDIVSNKKTDFTSVDDYDNSSKLSYCIYNETNGLSVVGVNPKLYMYTPVYIVIFAQLIIIAINVILLNTILSDKISRWFLPLISISNKVDFLAAGDLKIEFDETIASSEIEVLSSALNRTTENLNLYINDIKNVLKNLSDCKLNVETSDCYQGDFNEIKDSLESIIDNLNNVFSEINKTARGVSDNAEHMQASSQELAAGVTEQSEYINEMFSSIDKLSVLINSTAENSSKAREMAEKSSSLLAAEDQDMKNLLSSMDAIRVSSKQIGAIINTINEIADQTDLLALNASIEASRAGEAGKSFAVIASEVGSLAKNSAEAVNTITELITNSTNAVNQGVEIANRTAEHLSEAVSYSNESKNMIDEISVAANNQSQEIAKINSHVSQISSVTENNQAASQENFAISDEASNQAQLLKTMVDKFDFD